MFSAVLRLLPHSELIDVIRTLRGHCENKLAFLQAWSWSLFRSLHTQYLTVHYATHDVARMHPLSGLLNVKHPSGGLSYLS